MWLFLLKIKIFVKLLILNICFEKGTKEKKEKEKLKYIIFFSTAQTVNNLLHVIILLFQKTMTSNTTSNVKKENSLRKYIIQNQKLIVFLHLNNNYSTKIFKSNKSNCN